MKKLLSALLALALVFSLAACGSPQAPEEFRAYLGGQIRRDNTIWDQTDKDERLVNGWQIQDAPVVPDEPDTQDEPQVQQTPQQAPQQQTAPTYRPVVTPEPEPEVTTEATEETTEATTEATEETTEATEETTEATTEATEETTQETTEEADPGFYSYTHKDEVALYIHTYGCLPENFITKSEARALGWRSGSLEPYAPGMCIGGDRFYNREGLLPEAPGRYYTECDIDTLGASSRGAKRIVFSNDGLIYYTSDHYASFTLLYGEP